MKSYIANLNKFVSGVMIIGIILCICVGIIFFIILKKNSSQVVSSSNLTSTTTFEIKPFYTEEARSSYTEKTNFFFIVNKGGSEKDGYEFDIEAFDVTKNPVIKRIVKSFHLPEDIAATRNQIETAAQYSSASDSFYVRTATCIEEGNADCALEHYTIYKIGMSSSSPVKVFESASGTPSAINSWQMSSTGDYLYVEQQMLNYPQSSTSTYKNMTSLYTIDTVHNSVQKILSYDNLSDPDSQFTLALDEKYFYVKTQTKSGFFLTKYDSVTFENVGKIEIPISKEDLSGIDIALPGSVPLSPNGRYVAYFGKNTADEKQASSTTTVIIFDTKNSTSKVYMIKKSINNYAMFWSIDSTKLIVQLKDPLEQETDKRLPTILDIVTGSTTDIDVDANIYGLGFSGGGYIYLPSCHKTTLFNFIKNNFITFTDPFTKKECGWDSYLPGYGMF